MPLPTPAKRTPASRSGFTLLELVAVIGIIALMSVVVVAGFNGVMRAVSATTGADAMRRALMLARQQACVDGEDTYVWVTGVDTFAVVRKAGTVSKTDTATRKPEYLQLQGSETSVSTCKWIVDEYADLTSAGETFKIDRTDRTQSNKDIVSDIVNNYTGIKVFDMDTAKMADVRIPPWFEPADDAWVFGIEKSASGFAVGADYGWLIYPEQKLPAGYVFQGSYQTSGNKAGDFKEDYNRKVHFRADGTVESAADFVLYEVSTKKTQTVRVDGEGKVTVSSSD